MPPALRRDLLVAARQWRKLAAIADKRENDLVDATTLRNKKQA
jgi:sulfite reductase beta subunit-like hemoprotein